MDKLNNPFIFHISTDSYYLIECKDKKTITKFRAIFVLTPMFDGVATLLSYKYMKRAILLELVLFPQIKEYYCNGRNTNE